MAALAECNDTDHSAAPVKPDSSILPIGGSFQEINIAKIKDRWSSLPDLPLENATDLEKEKVETVRANILKAKGLKEPPTGTWKNHHYLRGQILCYLRARNGDVCEATKRAIECMDFMDVVFEKAKEYEEFPQSKRVLLEENIPQGILGKDKRGASVLFNKYGKSDQGPLVRRVGFDFFLCSHWRFSLYYWDTLFQESVANGVFLHGRSWVFDCDGITYAKILRSRWIGPKLAELYPGGEDPTPEGLRYVFVRNTPWIVQKAYEWTKPFLPERTQKKFFLFSKNDEKKYLEALFREIEPDQVPVCFGGSSKVRWPFSNGTSLGDESNDEHESINVATAETVETIVPPNSTCLIEMKVVSKDINVWIEALDATDGSKEVVQEKVRITSMEGWRSFRYSTQETMNAEDGDAGKSGQHSSKLMVTFDNSFSWLLRKTIYYRFVVLDTI